MQGYDGKYSQVLNRSVGSEFAIITGDGANVDIEFARLFNQTDRIFNRAWFGDHELVDKMQPGKLADAVNPAEDLVLRHLAA